MKFEDKILNLIYSKSEGGYWDFVNRWMNDTGQGETWTWGLGRYAMATFTYRFNDLSR